MKVGDGGMGRGTSKMKGGGGAGYRRGGVR